MSPDCNYIKLHFLKNFLITVANLKALHASFFIPNNLPKYWVQFQMESFADSGALTWAAVESLAATTGSMWPWGWRQRMPLISLSQRRGRGWCGKKVSFASRQTQILIPTPPLGRYVLYVCGQEANLPVSSGKKSWQCSFHAYCYKSKEKLSLSSARCPIRL